MDVKSKTSSSDIALNQARYWSLQGDLLSHMPEDRQCFLEIPAPQNETHLVWQGEAVALQQYHLAGAWRVGIVRTLSAGIYQYRIAQHQAQLAVFPEKLGENAWHALLRDVQQHLPAQLWQGLKSWGAIPQDAAMPAVSDWAAFETLLSHLHHALGSAAQHPSYRLKADIVPQSAQIYRGKPVPLSAMLRQSLQDAQARHWGQQFSVCDDTPERRLLSNILAQALRLLNTCPPMQASEWQQRLIRAAQVAKLSHTTTPQKMPCVPEYQMHAPYRQLCQLAAQFEQFQILPQLLQPLAHVHWLYQLWCALQVLWAVIRVAIPLGYQLHSQALYENIPVPRWHFHRDGRILLQGRHPEHHTQICLRLEPRYQSSHSTFLQRPDISVEIHVPQAPVRLCLWDAKYRLKTQQGTPKKADIDQMHAYRDALHTAGQREVVYAAILYPGVTVLYDQGRLAAIQALPQAQTDHRQDLSTQLAQVLRDALEPI